MAETWPDYKELAEATPYDGRHAWVSICAAANIPMLEIAANGGHSVTMPERVYGKVIREQAGNKATKPQTQLRAAIDQAAKLYDRAFPATADGAPPHRSAETTGSSIGSRAKVGLERRRRIIRRNGTLAG